jgi:transcriptional regulator with XRE-family HTH domain
MNITEKITALRTEKKIKSSEVAYALDMTQSNYARLEKRDKDLSINQLESIALALGVTVDDILHYGERKPQIVDNEKVKELERQILEKDLEINRSRYEIKMYEIKSSVIRILTQEKFIYNTVKICIDGFEDNFGFVINDIIASCFKTELGKDIVYMGLCIEKLNAITIDTMVEILVTEVKNQYIENRKYYNLFALLDTNLYADMFRKELDGVYVEMELNFNFSKSDYERFKLYKNRPNSFRSELEDKEFYELIDSGTTLIIDKFSIEPLSRYQVSFSPLNQNGLFRISQYNLQKLIDENRIKK